MVEARTTAGRVRGTVEDVPVFRGIPFAQPPVGDLRFAAPQHWDGVREALAFGPPPPQADAFGPAVAPYPEVESRRIWQDHTFAPLPLRTSRSG